MPRKLRALLVAASLAALAMAFAHAQAFRRGVGGEIPPMVRTGTPQAEFHLARLEYDTSRFAGSRDLRNPMWGVDWPYAEQHFVEALQRYTRIKAAPNSGIVALEDETIFDYPWLLVQQVAQGQWSPTRAEIERLREYLLRGGFVLFDDFHDEYEWQYFEQLMSAILPGRPIVELAADETFMNAFFELDPTVPIPGERHLGRGLDGPTHWRGVYDDEGRLVVGIAHNSDMGDAWEHADDPGYPTEMTASAYRFGTNFVIYALTH